MSKINLELEIDENIFNKASDICKTWFGMTTNQVIVNMLKMAARDNDLPFSPLIPNAETEQALRDAQEGKNLIHCNSAQDMFDRLDGNNVVNFPEKDK